MVPESPEPSAPSHRAVTPDPAGGRRRLAIVLVALGAGYLLASEHRAHFIAALPWLVLALCPLVHFFMHGRGHGHTDHDSHPRDPGTV